ncbi:MAG: hypothetical protein GY906_24920 [bacterium]|nr:hypothetical protein [bacterium]
MITRDSFLYMDPRNNKDNFAQCGSCMMWTSNKGPNAMRCHVIGKNTVVTAGMSCGLYVPGTPKPDGGVMPLVSPKEAGLVSRSVRCENCKWYVPKDSHCHLFMVLNKAKPKMFDLKEGVMAKGCCNAQEPHAAKEQAKGLR